MEMLATVPPSGRQQEALKSKGLRPTVSALTRSLKR